MVIHHIHETTHVSTELKREAKPSSDFNNTEKTQSELTYDILTAETETDYDAALIVMDCKDLKLTYEAQKIAEKDIPVNFYILNMWNEEYYEINKDHAIKKKCEEISAKIEMVLRGETQLPRITFMDSCTFYLDLIEPYKPIIDGKWGTQIMGIVLRLKFGVYHKRGCI